MPITTAELDQVFGGVVECPHGYGLARDGHPMPADGGTATANVKAKLVFEFSSGEVVYVNASVVMFVLDDVPADTLDRVVDP